MYKRALSIIFSIAIGVLVFTGPTYADESSVVVDVVTCETTTQDAVNDAWEKIKTEAEMANKRFEREQQLKMVSRGEFTREGKLPPVLLEQYPKAKSIGNMKVSFFTIHDAGCNEWGAWGDRILPYKSVAIDPSVYKHNSKFYVEGFGVMVAHDTGGDIKRNRMDIAVNTKKEAFALGRIQPKVWLLE